MRFFWLLIFLPMLLCSEPVPVLSEGRIRPLHIYAEKWLLDTYGSRSLPEMTAEELLWSLTLHGHEGWDDYPLFYLSRKIRDEVKLQTSHASYNQLSSLITSVESPGQELEKLIYRMTEYENFGTINPDPNIPVAQSVYGLKLLPSRRDLGTWLPINALALTQHNMTPYSDDQFNTLGRIYQQLRIHLDAELLLTFKDLLISEYSTIEGQNARRGAQSSLPLPTMGQLKAEQFYYLFPWTETTVALYVISLILFLIRPRIGIIFFLGAFLFHTAILGIRCYILSRPPVSNMFETVLYVPWIAAILGSLVAAWKKEWGPLIAATGVAAILLVLLSLIYPVHELEHAQAVLNSHYWLMIHVLMVVGSYGAFILSGLIAHYSLIKRFWAPIAQETRWTLASLYIGVILLITGTILGGVWAAQSWGRFWDWDPKESWAFISSCLYLAVIHAYRFGKLGNVGLAIGSIIGLQAITFTWYGVNYILGVGLHSYGFGQGGELFYALFVLCEFVFVIYCAIMHKKSGYLSLS